MFFDFNEYFILVNEYSNYFQLLQVYHGWGEWMKGINETLYMPGIKSELARIMEAKKRWGFSIEWRVMTESEWIEYIEEQMDKFGWPEE